MPIAERTQVEQALLAAWDAWDRRPGDPTAASRMLDSTIVVAEQLGVGWIEFHDALVERRRAGLDRPACLVEVVTRYRP